MKKIGGGITNAILFGLLLSLVSILFLGIVITKILFLISILISFIIIFLTYRFMDKNVDEMNKYGKGIIFSLISIYFVYFFLLDDHWMIDGSESMGYLVMVFLGILVFILTIIFLISLIGSFIFLLKYKNKEEVYKVVSFTFSNVISLAILVLLIISLNYLYYIGDKKADFCNGYKDSRGINRCFLYWSEVRGDLSLCEKISYPNIKELCKKEIIECFNLPNEKGYHMERDSCYQKEINYTLRYSLGLSD